MRYRMLYAGDSIYTKTREPHDPNQVLPLVKWANYLFFPVLHSAFVFSINLTRFMKNRDPILPEVLCDTAGDVERTFSKAPITISNN